MQILQNKMKISDIWFLVDAPATTFVACVFRRLLKQFLIVFVYKLWQNLNCHTSLSKNFQFTNQIANHFYKITIKQIKIEYFA